MPFPPSINHYYIRTPKGVFINKAANSFRNQVFLLSRKFIGCFTANDRLVVKVIFSAPNKRKFDLDNRLKGLLDGMQHAGIFPDDEQIDKLIVIRGEIIKNGCSSVSLACI